MSSSSTTQKKKLNFIPEILYEAPSYPGESISPIPYMLIPKDHEMPTGLFILEYKQTGEYEIGDKGKAEEITDGPYPHMFINFKAVEKVMMEKFPDLNIADVVDTLRVGLGMKPLAQAKAEGQAVLDKAARNAIENISQKLSAANNQQPTTNR